MATIGELIKKTDKNVDIGIVVDESGSMFSLKDTVIKCFNDFLNEQKQDGDDAFITLVKFNKDVNFVIKRKQISSAKDITNNSYDPDGTTALYDAIFETIKSIEKKNKNNNVIIAIITDGYENASRECTIDTIREIIKEKEKLGWKFLFLASNIDVNSTVKSFGMSADSARAYVSTSVGYTDMYKTLTNDVSMYRSQMRNLF